MLLVAVHFKEEPHHRFLHLLQHHTLAWHQLLLVKEDLEVTKWEGKYLRVLIRLGSRADITEFAKSF